MANQSGKNTSNIGVVRAMLAEMTPINALSKEHLQTLLRETRVIKVPDGKLLFRQGDKDGRAVFLLEGRVELNDGARSELITAGTDKASHPLAPAYPRKYTATARGETIIAHLDRSLLDVMLTWDQSSDGLQVNEIDSSEDSDWMSRMLTSPVMSRIPPSNLQALFMKVEAMPVKAGQVIINQGDEGDYFYMINRGRCQVSRRTRQNPEPVVLAELSQGASFGEEALISENRRNASVTMMTDGELMRLAKQDFLSLLKEPIVQWLEYAQARQLVEEGAIWLDVRLPSEFKEKHLENSINIPLVLLRQKIPLLDASKIYVVVCDTGRRSSSAAFILNERGLTAYVLKDGLEGVGSADPA
jgi:CRP-like cAMP-binding protein